MRRRLRSLAARSGERRYPGPGLGPARRYELRRVSGRIAHRVKRGRQSVEPDDIDLHSYRSKMHDDRQQVSVYGQFHADGNDDTCRLDTGR